MTINKKGVFRTYFTALQFTVSLMLISLTMGIAQAQLVGPVSPPPLGMVFSQTGVPHDGLWGRPGGKDYFFSNVNHADNTPVYWGVADQGVKLSLDGADYSSPGEIMSFDPTLSNLLNGVVGWSGQTTIITPSGARTAYTRFVATLVDGVTKDPVALTLATDEGLPPDVGAIFSVVNSAASFDVNVLFTASLVDGGSYTPHLAFFDPLTDASQGGKAHSSLISGFYYVNTPPFITANVNLEVDEGGSATVDSAHLSADDYESGPEGLTYTLNPANQASIPEHGILYNGGVALVTDDTFTQAEINADLITYTHDGSEFTLDGYNFTVHDEQGAIAADGEFTLFRSTINITPLNDPPVAINGSGQAQRDGTFAGFFEASDAENDPLVFSVLSADIGIAELVDVNTGSFTYAAPVGYIGDATIEFQVFDGEYFSDVKGEFFVTVPANVPPVAINGSGVSQLDGSFAGFFEASDAENDSLVFSVVGADFGIAQIVDANTGSFTYAAPGGFIWDATIEFQVFDGQDFADINGEFVVTVLDPQLAVLHNGDLLIADGDELILHNLPGNTDWVLSSGNHFTKLSSIAFDGVDGLYVLDKTNGLIKVDPVTGDQTVIASGDNFSPDSPGSIATLGVDDVLVANLDFAGTPSLLEVKTANGAVTTLSQGNLIPVLTTTAVGADGRVFVSDASFFTGGSSGIVEIDPLNGAQSSISLGGFLAVPLGMAVEPDGNIVVADAAAAVAEDNASNGGIEPAPVNRVLRISPAGVQTILTDGGAALDELSDITAGHNGKIYIANGVSIFEIDAVTGTPTLVPTEPVVDMPSDVLVYFKDGIFSDGFEGSPPVP